MVAEMIRWNVFHAATNVGKPRSDESYKLVDEGLIEARRFQRDHGFEELARLRKLAFELGDEVLHNIVEAAVTTAEFIVSNVDRETRAFSRKHSDRRTGPRDARCVRGGG
jgi:hypothetical protein